MKFTSILLAILSGILLWLGWPTYGFAGLLFVAFIPLLLAERRLRLDQRKCTAGKVLLHAYLTFFIWNIATTSWLYFSTPFGMWFAVLANSLLMSLVFLGYHLMAKKATQGAALTFLACLWIGFEWMHLHWEFSWPWLNLGNGFSEHVSWIQWYEYTGTFGGTLWIWLVNIMLFLGVFRFRESEKNLKQRLKKAILPVLIIILPLIVSVIISMLNMEIITNKADDGIPVIIVQPNIDPYQEKYYTTNDSIARLMINLVAPELNEQTQLIIAPETVLADSSTRLNTLAQDPGTLKIKEILNSYSQTAYLGGVSMADVFRDEERVTTQTNVANGGNLFYNDYNSAMFLTPDGYQPQLYHKSKLVVGVENFPYKEFLQPILGDAMLDLGGTVATKTTQTERSVFTTPDSLKVAPVICYESVYGEYVTDYVKNDADFLAIITNDAWWDETQGHKQHLSLARLRAIETRRWIARSANTGISAIINHEGEIIQSLGYGEQGIISGTIRPRKGLTFYVKHGDYIARIAGLMGIFIVLFSVFKRGTMKRK